MVKRLVVPFSVKEVSEAGDFEGYGSTFGNTDLGGDIVKRGAFKETLREWKREKQLPAMFWLHDQSEPIGEYSEMAEDEHGLRVKGTLWVEGNSLGRRPIAKAEQVRNLFLSTGPKGLSIGYDPTKVSFDEVDGERVRNLEKVKLFELSPVPFGMNPAATVFAAKAFTTDAGDIASKRDIERSLRDAGLSARQAKAFLAEGYAGLCRDDTDEDAQELVESLTKLKTILG